MISVEIHKKRNLPGIIVYLEVPEEKKEATIERGEELKKKLKSALNRIDKNFAVSPLAKGAKHGKYHYCVMIEYPKDCSIQQIEKADKIIETEAEKPF